MRRRGRASLVSQALAAKDDVILISRATGPAGAPVDASAFSPSISADGGRVAFETFADDLSAEDDNGVTNIFVRDAVTNATILVSRATGAAGAGADATSGGAEISGDGRFVVFVSDADNLSPDDNDADDNVFVRDLAAGTTTLVSRASGAGGAAADARAHDAGISADGRYVVFRSGADNLSPDDDDGVRQHLRARPGRQHDHAGQQARRRAAGPRPTTAPSTPASRATATGSPSPPGRTTSPTRTTTAWERLRAGHRRRDGHAGQPRDAAPAARPPTTRPTAPASPPRAAS